MCLFFCAPNQKHKHLVRFWSVKRVELGASSGKLWFPHFDTQTDKELRLDIE